MKREFLLVTASAIGLVLKEKIVVYPKCSVASDVWSEYYNLPTFDGG